MAEGLKIRKDGEIDFLSLGALVYRLDPGIIPFRKATECHIHVSGGEFNVAANLSNCFGLKTTIVSAMSDYPIGDLIAERVLAMGVKPIYRHFKHDGVSGPNMATVYSDRGFGVRGPVVFYNRANEAAAQLKPGDFDWKAIFAGGVRWVHCGGIFAALSPTTAELAVEMMREAKAAGAVTSFDFELQREALEDSWGRHARRSDDCHDRRERRRAGRQRRGSAKGLGHSETEDAARSKLDPSVFFGMMDQVVKKLPHVKIVATTLREVHSTNRHSWSAVAWIEGKTYTAPTAELDVLDRVGGGDGFAAGFIYGLLTGEPPETALKLGWAHGALLTTFPGDTTMATLDQVRAFAKGGSARIQR